MPNRRETPVRSLRRFTLVELLVVIAIISVLAAMLLPALQHAQGKARQISCASNLKQMGVAVLMYIPDNKEFYPQAQYKDNNGVWRYWPEFLNNPYCQNPKLFACPSDPDFGFTCDGRIPLSYIANYNFFPQWDFPPRPVSKVRNPNQKIMLGPNADGPADEAEPMFATTGSGNRIGVAWARVGLKRHGDGGNYLFGDNHLRFLFKIEAMQEAEYWTIPEAW